MKSKEPKFMVKPAKAPAASRGKLISNSPAMAASKGTSAPQMTAVGSGSRPTASKFAIASSAPTDARGLGGRNKTPNKPL